ncbi:hypothetical protein EXIGLDRAFT_705504 [Exidia glandulosa HHB12029]|uniref:Uncharacterized protein n=1 Tax=Exidia glandulosa HHB12029 TaxID=1314781 RepID=A0A165Z8R5_EXIGL|nr:hypothetical protein EXIGLDRAFT_705504 [Exidia glandulosa HHB12029]
MRQYIQSRPEVVFAAQRKEKHDFFKDKTFVATQVSARIHNLFYVASAWRMIWTILVHIAELIRDDLPIRQQLSGNDRLRSYFLVLYDCINDVIEVGKQQVSQLIIASPFYSQYFALNKDGTVHFNPDHIRDAHKSLLTTIMLELALTDSTYPLNVLMSCLGDSVADAPKGKHRISQSLWDAVGDLSIAVDFRGELDAALIDPAADFKKWFNSAPEFPEGYKKYKEAIPLSEEASQMIDRFKDIIYPLERTENSRTLLMLWNAINDNYATVAGKSIEALWLLEGAWEQTPKWSTYFLPDLNEESDPDSRFDQKRLQLHKKAKGRNAAPSKPRLMITNTAANDESDDDDLPELLDVSDSSEEDDSDSDEYEEEDEDDESDYDEDDMEQLDDLMREALEHQFQSPEDNPNVPTDIENNPFIRMMKSLKGRWASLDPRSKSTGHAPAPDPRMKVRPEKPVYGPPRPPPKAEPSKKPPPAPPQPSSTKATVEEVVDEEAGGVSAAKKKKKKKKKKPAKKTDSEAIAQGEAAGASATPATPPPPSPTPSPAPSPAKPAAEKKAPPKPAKVNPLVKEYDPSMSLLSLSLGPETAQSARSYLNQQAAESKVKVKSRPNEPPAPEKRSLFSRLRRQQDDELDETDKKKDPKKSSTRWGMFSGLKSKASKTLRMIIAPSKDERGKKSIRWEDFERAMVNLGFTVDGSTAGSSVRFTPRSGESVSSGIVSGDDELTETRCKPITFHKPHPDSTIHPVMLLEFSKRLKEKYGWSEEMFQNWEED